MIMGTIPPLFESIKILDDKRFDIIAVAGANHPSKEMAVEKAAKKLLGKHAGKANVEIASLQLFAFGTLA